MSLLGDIGNFLGNVFGANQKKKKDEEQQQQQRPATVRPSSDFRINVPSGATQQQAATPQAPKPLVQPQQKLGGINVPSAQSQGAYKGKDLSGLSAEDSATAKNFIDRGKNADGFIGAARTSKQSQDKSAYENSFVGKALNTIGNAPRVVAGATVDGVNFLSRVPQTYETARDSAIIAANKALGVDTKRDSALAQSTQDRYKNLQTGLSKITNAVADDSNASTNEETEREAREISSGKGTLGDYVSASLKSFGGATVAPLGKFVGTAGKLAKTAERQAPDAAKEVRNEIIGAADDIKMNGESAVPNRTVSARSATGETNSPITASPTTNKAPAITSPNRPAGVTPQPAAPQQPQSLFESQQPQQPAIGGIEPVRVPEAQPVRPEAQTPQIDDGTAELQRMLDEAQARREAEVQAPIEEPAAPQAQVIETPIQEQSRVMAQEAAPINTEAVVSQSLDEAARQAPTEAIADNLGSITRRSILDGSINTPEGIDSTIGRVTQTANSQADATGSNLSDIIKKGQKVWEASRQAGHDFTTKEASDLFKGKFTPEQQAVYKNYAQEIGTLRDRSGFSLEGGQQGAWYGPRQSLNDLGESADFDPRLVNEISRNKDQVNGGIEEGMLDTSAVPYEQAIRRYANAPDASSQLMVNAVENSPETGLPSGLKVPDAAKEKLETSLTAITEKRDRALKLQDEGDIEGANKLGSEVQSDINRTFNEFIDDIPGAGRMRREAIENVKAMRGTYMQSTMQTLSLSNVVNRVADQGTRAVFDAQKPLVRGLEKAFSGSMQKKAAAEGVEGLPLNTSKEARQAANTFAKGTLLRETKDNFKANISQAGAGRGFLGKAIAKADAIPRAASTALTQLGDLSTQNVQKALQLGASRAEAAGLKTKADYEKYFAEYVNTENFQEDLARVKQTTNPRIGLAGGRSDNMQAGGKISNALSKYADNGVRTAADKVGIKPTNRLVNEANDYVKGNLTGYAGVGSRVFGNVLNAGALGIPRVLKAANVAKSGDPTAVAQATQMAAQSVADAIATYGTGAAAAGLIAASDGKIGYTGAPAELGSSQSAYNKANNIPANQWYVQIGDKRVYFDPSRPFGGPGVGANVAGAIATGKDVGSAVGNSISQVFNQAGGGSILDNVENVRTNFNPYASEADKKYAREQLQAAAAPSTGFINNIANFVDDKKRSTDNFIDDIKQNVPVLRAQTPTAKDSRGNDIQNSKQLSGGSGLFSVGNAPGAKPSSSKASDPVGDEINRLQGLGSDVFPTNANKNATDKSTQTLSKVLVNSDYYKNADDAGKADYMKKVLNGSDAKDISDSLKDDQKAVLLQKKLVGDKKFEPLLDDSATAAKYYRASYENEKANGTLTKKDEDLSNPSGAKYKAVVAEVDDKAGISYGDKQTYGDTSQSEFKALLNPKSDSYDPDAAQKLYEYDQKRVAAGLPPKYDLTKAKAQLAKSGGKGGSKSGGSFSFASLPSSLIGSGSSSDSKYAEAASLFKPIADLKAPAPKEIPKGRTITVKKGLNV